MRILNVFGVSLALLVLGGCSPVKVPVTNQYQLTGYSSKHISKHPRNLAIWVTPPEAAAGYQTEQMQYINKPYQLEAFVKNSWTSPPADMIYPLMVQSLQGTGYFHAVMSSAYSQGADYRVDTQVLSLNQNFLRKPSFIELSVKVVLTRVENNKVLASRIFTQKVPCPSDNPYGGVVAANAATRQFTAEMSQFVVSHIKKP